MLISPIALNWYTICLSFNSRNILFYLVMTAFRSTTLGLSPPHKVSSPSSFPSHHSSPLIYRLTPLLPSPSTHPPSCLTHQPTIPHVSESWIQIPCSATLHPSPSSGSSSSSSSSRSPALQPSHPPLPGRLYTWPVYLLSNCSRLYRWYTPVMFPGPYPYPPPSRHSAPTLLTMLLSPLHCLQPSIILLVQPLLNQIICYYPWNQW